MEKNTNKKVEKILEDIYLIDSSLKKQEDKLKNLIREMIETEPEINLDENFIIHLKEKIFSQLNNSEEKEKKKTFFWQKLTYVSASTAIVILLIVLMMPSFVVNDFKDRQKITQLADRAFGDLIISLEQTESDDRMSEGEILGLGSSETMTISQTQDISILPYPIEQKNYRYVYNGEMLEELDINEISDLVYKRDSRDNIARLAASNLDNISGLPIDISSFSQRQLNNFNIIEDKDYGYSIFVNLNNNNITINSNWQKWPQPYRDCQDQDCIERLQLDKSDMLSEEKLINIADSFIRRYNIDLSYYGKAYISKETIASLENKENNPNHRYPEQVNIVYPLIIDNKNVVNNNGNKEGVQVGINIREERVSNVYNLNFSNFISSSYQLIDDLNRIDPLLSKGGLNTRLYRENDQEEIIVELDDPIIALVKTYQDGSELYLPSLVFSTKENISDYYLHNKVVIPLVKEIFEETLTRLERNEHDYEIMPMPRAAPDLLSDDLIDKPQKDESYRIMPIE